jgi:succinate-semialdehyde dehydrogenase/glutarate-semialdehyde dehydrogenase
MKDAQLFIGGKWIDSKTQSPVLDKFSRKEVAQAHVADEELVERAVAAAKTAFRSGEIAIPDRYKILMRASGILDRRRDEIVDVMVTETGFTPADNAGDVSRCIQTAYRRKRRNA